MNSICFTEAPATEPSFHDLATWLMPGHYSLLKAVTRRAPGFSRAKHIPPSNIPIERDLLDCSLPAMRGERLFPGARLNALTASSCFQLLFFLRPNLPPLQQRLLLPAQVAIKKPDDHVQGIPGLRNITLVEETVKVALPTHAVPHQLPISLIAHEYRERNSTQNRGYR